MDDQPAVADPVVTRGFRGRRAGDAALAARTPPGQYLVEDFPVLTAGPTPVVDPATWRLRVDGLVAHAGAWSFADLLALPQVDVVTDIHCVTRWSRLDTRWRGVSLDVVMALVQPTADATHVLFHAEGGYTTNLPLDDVLDGRAWIVHTHDDAPLERAHGGPVRMLVPGRYFWKSAKWVDRIELLAEDRPGFWEQLGYHALGDPWREQRHWGD